MYKIDMLLAAILLFQLGHAQPVARYNGQGKVLQEKTRVYSGRLQSTGNYPAYGYRNLQIGETYQPYDIRGGKIYGADKSFAKGHLLLHSTGTTSSGTITGSGGVGTGSSAGSIGSSGPAMGVNGQNIYAGSGMYGLGPIKPSSADVLKPDRRKHNIKTIQH